MTNRRQFLWQCSALTMVAGLAPATALATQPNQLRGAVTLAELGFTDFAAQVGTSFRVATGQESAFTLQLLTAEHLPASIPGAADAGHEKFCLQFQGPATAALSQNTHAFAHPVLGQFAMFITPVGPAQAGTQRYEAVFNRPPSGTLPLT